ncbi:MAG: class I SAM-dependent methyltransferase [Actinomycetota bacterium]|nr:class I SAM-dependent methyltransferase [Actinomycetota bacterium]
MVALMQRVGSLWWKGFYPYFTRRADDDMLFFNWAYEEEPPMGIPLSDEDEKHRYPIQLYHATAAQGELSGKRVLEVGCGHGGGASYLARTFGPASYQGLDRNRTGIRFCRRRHHGVPRLSFTPGDAEALPFAEGSFDVVMNVESSHCYPHFDRFLSEVSRVLAPKGSLLYTDFRKRAECGDWEADLAAAPGLQIASWRDISDDVARGMGLNSRYLSAVSENLSPIPFLRSRMRKGAPAEGSWHQTGLRDGDASYRLYHLVRS